MRIYDKQINRDRCWGWFNEYAREFISSTFGPEALKDYSSGTLSWNYCTFSFTLTTGERFHGSFSYDEETNRGNNYLEILRKVWSNEDCKYLLIPFEA